MLAGRGRAPATKKATAQRPAMGRTMQTGGQSGAEACDCMAPHADAAKEGRI
jgi:hypothetical protein